MDGRHYVVVTASVVHPSFEYPLVCLVLSLVSGKGRILQRFTSLDALKSFICVPEEYIDRLVDGCSKARVEVDEIQTKLKTLMRISNLAPGSQVVRTDTGEIVAEAENIIKEKQYG